MKIVKPLEGFGLLLKGVSETMQNKSEISKRKISWNVIRCIRCKVITKTLPGKEINRAGDGIIKAGYGSKGSLIKRNLIPAHLLTNIGMQKYN